MRASPPPTRTSSRLQMCRLQMCRLQVRVHALVLRRLSYQTAWTMRNSFTWELISRCLNTNSVPLCN